MKNKLTVCIVRMLAREPHKSYLKQLNSDLPKKCRAIVAMHGDYEIEKSERRALRKWVKRGGIIWHLAKKNLLVGEAIQRAWLKTMKKFPNTKAFAKLDDDCFVSSEGVLHLYRLLKENSECGLIGPIGIWESRRECPVKKVPRHEIVKGGKYLKMDFHPYSTRDIQMARVDALDDVGGWNDKLAVSEDTNLALRMMDKGWDSGCTAIACYSKAGYLNSRIKVSKSEKVRRYVQWMLATLDQVKTEWVRIKLLRFCKNLGRSKYACEILKKGVEI